MYEFASSSATLLTVYTAVMHTRRMNVIPEAELCNYDSYLYLVFTLSIIQPGWKESSPRIIDFR